MPYTPVELRHVRLGRALFGYKREETETLLDDVADSFEEVWRDRGELTDKLEELEKRLDEFKQREQLLSSTLVAAERSAAEAKETARREAEVIVAEAHQEARSVLRGTQGERERLIAETRRLQALMRSALGMIEEGLHGTAEQPEAPLETPSDTWPARQDTREFEAVSPPAHEPEPEPEPAPFEWGPDPEPDPEPPPAAAEVKLPPILAVPDTGPEDDDAPRDFAWG